MLPRTPHTLVVGAALAVGLAGAARGESPATEWPHYGGDAGGMRFSPLDEITPENVTGLEVAWTYRHGDVCDGENCSESAFEATPILAEGGLFFCTPFNKVVALDPETGAERWTHDPGLDLSVDYANQFTCRGVAHWRDTRRGGGVCSSRIFTATNESRLLALDAASGELCADFGDQGQVDLLRGVGELASRGEYQVTSPPLVAGDRIVVGSAVGDNRRIDAPSGVVRAYDARSGALVWAWDLRPPGRPPPAEGYTPATPNVWAPMAYDAARDLVFVPTGNPAPDYYRGHDPEIDYYGSSVIALRGATGAIAWRFQTVHHDLWDYDVPAQPTLFDLRREGGMVPALVQATKMGLLFILQRETGEPLFPVEERPVPQDGAPGQVLSPTQPFPVKPPPLVRHTLPPEDAWGLTPFDRRACRNQIAALRSDGIYTPPTLQGSVMYPGNAGGSNWGGVAIDPERQVLVANTMDLPWVVRLFPGENYEAEREANPGEVAPQEGTRFGMVRSALLSPLGLPCNAPPWGTLTAVNLATGEFRWQVRLGTVRDIAPLPIPWKAGVPNLGGPLVTAAGLVFVAATFDDYLRAFDVATGDELWKGRLPAGGQATPMTYRVRPGGRQLVVIAAGGYGRIGNNMGDHLVAYALPAAAQGD